jgi:hypothetical protein
VAVPVLELADGEDLPVGLDGDVLRSFRKELLRIAEDVVRPHPAVAGEARVERAGRGGCRESEHE